MDENKRKKIIGSVDIVVAIFIILTGFVVIWFSIDWGEFYNTWSSPYQPEFFNKTTWIFLLVGITTVVYGIKRMIQNVVL